MIILRNTVLTMDLVLVSLCRQWVVSKLRKLSILMFLVHLNVHELTLIASLAGHPQDVVWPTMGSKEVVIRVSMLT